MVPEGHREVPDGVEKQECAGALLLIQRELKLLEKDVHGYQKNRRGGLTRAGIAWWALNRCFLARTPLGSDPVPVIPEDPDIGYAPLDHVLSER